MTKHKTARCCFLRSGMIGALCLLSSFSVLAGDAIRTQDTILFLGDSITAQGGYIRAIDAALKKEKDPPKIVCRGKNSETVSGLSEAYHPGVRPCLFARLDKELTRAKPDWVVACYGINCGIYHPFDEKRFEAYKAGINRLIKEVHASGSHLILLTPPPYAKKGPSFPGGTDAASREKILREANKKAQAEAEKNPKKYGYRTPYAYYDHVMETYATWLLSLNNQNNVWVIDLRKPMLLRSKETHGRDPIHPNKIGHEIMASSFLEQWPRIKKEALPSKKDSVKNKEFKQKNPPDKK